MLHRIKINLNRPVMMELHIVYISCSIGNQEPTAFLLSKSTFDRTSSPITNKLDDSNPLWSTSGFRFKNSIVTFISGLQNDEILVESIYHNACECKEGLNYA